MDIEVAPQISPYARKKWTAGGIFGPHAMAVLSFGRALTYSIFSFAWLEPIDSIGPQSSESLWLEH
jgi:hypothetical protein